MVPLPLHADGIGSEPVVGRHGLAGRTRFDVGLGVGVVGYAVVAEDRPLVYPSHRLQVWHAAQTAEVLLQNGDELISDGIANLEKMVKLIKEYNAANPNNTMSLPTIRAIITDDQYGYLSNEGIYIIPIGCLKN